MRSEASFANKSRCIGVFRVYDKDVYNILQCKTAVGWKVNSYGDGKTSWSLAHIRTHHRLSSNAQYSMYSVRAGRITYYHREGE